MKIGVVEEPAWGLYRKKTINYRGQLPMTTVATALTAANPPVNFKPVVVD